MRTTPICGGGSPQPECEAPGAAHPLLGMAVPLAGVTHPLPGMTHPLRAVARSLLGVSGPLGGVIAPLGAMMRPIRPARGSLRASPVRLDCHPTAPNPPQTQKNGGTATTVCQSGSLPDLLLALISGKC